MTTCDNYGFGSLSLIMSSMGGGYSQYLGRAKWPILMVPFLCQDPKDPVREHGGQNCTNVPFLVALLFLKLKTLLINIPQGTLF